MYRLGQKFLDSFLILSLILSLSFSPDERACVSYIAYLSMAIHSHEVTRKI